MTNTQTETNAETGSVSAGIEPGPVPDAEVTPAVITSPARLPDHTVACLGCGVPTPAPAERSAVTWAEPVDRAGNPTHTPQRVDPEPMGRCPDCQRVADLAAELIAAHPALAARLGPDTARHRGESALLALAALGARLPAGTVTPPELGSLLRHLAEPGAGAKTVVVFDQLWCRVEKHTPHHGALLFIISPVSRNSND